MNLWPFSKKASDEFVLDSTMHLPPGVVLAAPDDPELADLPIPSVPTPQHTTDEHTSPDAIAMIEEPPALPKQNEPPLSPEIQQILGLAPAPTVPIPHTSDLPDLPPELFGESAPWLATVSTSPVAEPSPSITFDLDSASETETSGVWTPSEPEPDQPTITYSEPTAMEMPSLIPDPTQSGPILSELFLDTPDDLSSQPITIENQQPDELLSVASPTHSSLESSTEEMSWEISPNTETDQFYTPLETFDTFDETIMEPMELNSPQPDTDDSALSFSIGDDETAALMPPPDQKSVPILNRHTSEAAQSLQEASGALADLLADAESFQTDDSWGHATEPSFYEAQPTSPTANNNNFDTDDFTPSIEIETSADNTSFFASATFDDMDSFEQAGSDSSLFMEDTTAAASAESYCLSTDNTVPALEIQDSSDLETEWAPNAYDDEESSDVYMLGDEASISGPSVPGAFLPEELPEEEQDEFSHMAIDDELETGDDSMSYDMGHYDDPDEPAVAFVLDERLDDEEEVEQPRYFATNQETAANSPADISAQYYYGPEMPVELATPAPVEEIPLPPPQPKAEPVSPQRMMPIESAAPAPVEEIPSLPPQPKEEPVKPQPASQPPITHAAMQKPRPSEPIPPKLPPRHTSVIDALDSFEQEMLMRDSQFITQSINNLVDRYFAQKKAENEW